MPSRAEHNWNASFAEEIIGPQHIVTALHLMIDVLDAGLRGTHKRDGVTDAWVPSDALVDEFKQGLKKQGLEFTAAELKDNDTFIRQQLRKEVFVNVFDVERSRKLTIETDPTVLKGIESLPKAKELLDKARQLLVQRRTR